MIFLGGEYLIPDENNNSREHPNVYSAGRPYLILLISCDSDMMIFLCHQAVSATFPTSKLSTRHQLID